MDERTVWSLGSIGNALVYEATVGWCSANLKTRECKVYRSRVDPKGDIFDKGEEIVFVAVRSAEFTDYLEFLEKIFSESEFKSHKMNGTAQTLFISCVGASITADKVHQSLLLFK